MVNAEKEFDMTCIVNYKTKKAFKEAVAEGLRVIVEDPSFFDPYHGTLDNYLETRGGCVVTNHPKRSWFAAVEKKNGKVVVS